MPGLGLGLELGARELDWQLGFSLVDVALNELLAEDGTAITLEDETAILLES